MKVLRQLTLSVITAAVILSFTLSAVSQNILYYSKAPAGFASRLLSKSALRKDMDYWQRVLEESHVNPYHAISKSDLEKMKKAVLKSLPDSVTQFQASFAVSQLIGALNEGHLGFATSRVSDSVYSVDCIRFPYLLSAFEDGAFVVQRDLSQTQRLPPGALIVAINGVPSASLYQKYRLLFGGLETWRRLQVKDNIRKLLFMDGIHSPFDIKAVLNGDTINFKTEGYDRLQADSISKKLSTELLTPEPFSFRMLDNNIAYLEFNSMNNYLAPLWYAFLRRAFAEIRDKKANGVIIDIRKNGGGNSELGDSLISYISNKPYRGSAGVKMRISRHSKDFAKLTGRQDPFSNWKNGRLYVYKAGAPAPAPDNPLRFNGKVAVLIGTGTFSSANMLTNAIKDYQLATLFGQSTAEPANDFGEIVPFMLPNTHIIASTAIKMFTRANGDDSNFEGIHPDFEIPPYIPDAVKKGDPVLQKAIEWILR